VVYPGSIERVDFGEVEDEKFFVLARVSKGETQVEWRKLEQIRPFLDRFLLLESKDELNQQILGALPAPEVLEGAIVRLTLEYPRDWEPLIDDQALRQAAAGAFEFHLVKRPQVESRIRLPEDQSVGSMAPLELLETYWRASHTGEDDIEALKKLATAVISAVDQPDLDDR
jgi:exonuclease SbcD